MGVLTDLFIQVGAYMFVFLGALLTMNFLTKGYILSYLLVKISRGKKILVRIYSLTGKYYKPGIVSEKTLKYKSRDKEKRTYSNVTRECIFDEMGVKCIEVDDETGNFVKQTDFTAVPGNDPVKTDNLLVRALEKPLIQDKKELIILGLLIVVLICVGVVLYMVYNLDVRIRGLNII